MQAETIYQTLLWVGALGVGVMGVLGAAAHGSHGSHGHAHGHHGADTGHGFGDGHGHGGMHHHGGADHAPAHHSPAHHHGGNGHANGYGEHGASSSGAHHHAAPHSRAEGGATAIAAILGIVSPLTLFSVSLGAGATGLLLGTRFPVVLTAILAALAGFALFALVVRPLTAWVQRWASKPAQALAGVVAAEATAQNRFDEHGRGIVNVSIDGQIVRLLAYMERDDHAKGITVAPGDRLVVTQIDEAKNTCRVAKI